MKKKLSVENKLAVQLKKRRRISIAKIRCNLILFEIGTKRSEN